MITAKTALDRAFERFQIATGLIAEDNRPAAAKQLRAAVRILNPHPSAADLRADLEQLLDGCILGRTS